MSLNALSFGAIGDGITDNTAALQAAIDAAYSQKTSLLIPSGVYLTNTLNMPYDQTNKYNRGNYISGEGPLNTVLKAISPSTCIFKFTQVSQTFNWQAWGKISNMELDGGLTAISGQGLFSYKFKNLYIHNSTKGIVIKNTGNPGDIDASNHIIISNSRIENCSQWGIFFDLRTGNNENSFLSIKNSTIESCGTLAGAIGGGMYWRGQMLQFDNSAFVTNNNRGLYIEGGSGLGSNILGNNLCFENNIGMHVQCYGITGMYFNNLQMYSNDTCKTTYGIYLNGQSSLISQVRINSAKVRASAGNNPHVAFLAVGAGAELASIVVDSKQVRWDNYGYPGQTKYVGFTVI